MKSAVAFFPATAIINVTGVTRKIYMVEIISLLIYITL